MTQKVLRVGSSAAVTIPKRSLEELGLRVGDRVSVKVDTRRKIVSIVPTKKFSKADEKIARLTLNFIERYRRDFDALARK